MRAWSEEDPLFRGDTRGGPDAPEPEADASIVRHLLYLEGYGRSSPYLSTTELEDIAREKYAGPNGIVRRTDLAQARQLEVGHCGRDELLQLLVGKGKGRAAWKNSFEVAQARRYVEESLEHLLDFRGHKALSREERLALVESLFNSERGAS